MIIARKFDGKKFMWDGKTYQGHSEAEEAKRRYQTDGFEVELVEEGGQRLLFTRRVVKEVRVE